MRKLAAAWIVVLCVSMSSTIVARESAADRMYQRLRALEGTWEGTLEWSGGRTGSGNVKATYYLTAGGYALVENLFMGGTATASMSTVYHIDGGDLRMTHYCIARNQPRLKAKTINEAAGIIDFAFMDVTGSDPPNRPSVRHATLHLISPTQLKIWFTFTGGNDHGVDVEEISLTRVTG